MVGSDPAAVVRRGNSSTGRFESLRSQVARWPSSSVRCIMAVSAYGIGFGDRMATYRYSRWDGTQQLFGLDDGDVMDTL